MDLHLIPYGIIATGHEKGVIEVVQNAKTVATVPKMSSNVMLCPQVTTDTKTIWRCPVIVQRRSHL